MQLSPSRISEANLTNDSNPKEAGFRKPPPNQPSTASPTAPPRLGKAIGIIGIPDTVNESRLRAIIPNNLVITTVEMRPEHEGAIVEFENQAVSQKKLKQD